MFAPILLNTIEGVRTIDPLYLDTARAYRISRRRRVTHVLLPAASGIAGRVQDFLHGRRQSLVTRTDLGHDDSYMGEMAVPSGYPLPAHACRPSRRFPNWFPRLLRGVASA